MPIRPSTTVAATAPRGGRQRRSRQPEELQVHDLRHHHRAAAVPAATPNSAVASPSSEIFERVGDEQRAAGGAERLEHDGIVDAVPMAGGERAAEHQRGDQRVSARWRRGCASTRFVDDAADGIERLAYPYRGDGGECSATALSSAISSAVVPPPG